MSIRYIGDLASQDAALLQSLAQRAGSILEFGSGGSTQIFAQAAPVGTTIVSVETDPGWVSRTQRNFKLLDIAAPVTYLSWKEWLRATARPFDLVFNDGIDKLRLTFALRAWPMVPIGGKLLFHDTRRPKDFKGVSAFLNEVFLETSSVQVNADDSNITIITKQGARAWEDWNIVEERAKWEYGHAEPPASLWENEPNE